MSTVTNEELYEYLKAHPETRKVLTDLYCNGQNELANELIKTLGFPTTIVSFMMYLSML